MPERNHTPGPWMGEGIDIATEPDEGGWQRLVASISGLSDQSEQDANARLIAAAPDLLDALVRIQDELGCDDPECAVCLLARAAIAKATEGK